MDRRALATLLDAGRVVESLEYELCERNLAEFTRKAWGIVEPATPFGSNWHIDLISEYLEAVTSGQIRDLVINMPPRHGKSTLVSVAWPVWVWIHNPAFRWIFASYAADLATRDSLKCRRIIESAWFGRRWGDCFRLTGDQNVKSRFENDATGYRISAGVGGSLTGEGGDAIVVDDPHNLKEIHSDLKRQAVLEWWDQVMSTRRNDPSTSSRVVVMQRGHQRDLAGHLIEHGGYEVLEIPTVAERRTVVHFPISMRELVREEGALLWPERFTAEVIAQARVELGTYGFAAQHQQRPSPMGSGIVRRGWWKYWAGDRPAGRMIQSWDTAFKSGEESDYSVGTTWVEGADGYYLLDLWRGRVEYPELRRAVVAQYDKHRPSLVVVEDKASGQSLIQELRRETRLPVFAAKVDSDKVARANAVSPAIEAGRVFLPERAEWVDVLLSEFDQFPNGAHDDQVDSVSQALQFFLGLLKNCLAEPRIRSL